ncbi:uncharacterized protein [Argopecten irradians]|uniref:uncharacterized protein isoform X1 n=1 Tax=Argopecten irradians TaxID=31199 RepID=UPI0037241EA5
MASGSSKDAILKKGKTDDKRTQLFSSPLDLIPDAGAKITEKVISNKPNQKNDNDGKKSTSKSVKPASRPTAAITSEERETSNSRKECNNTVPTQSSYSGRKDDISALEKSLCALTSHMTQMSQNMSSFMTEVRGQQAEIFECLAQNNGEYADTYEEEMDVETDGVCDLAPQQQMSMLLENSDTTAVDRQATSSSTAASTSRPNNETESESVLLTQLQDKYNKTEKVSPAINPELAKVVTTMVDQGLDDTHVTELMEKYKRPNNCDSLTVSKINQELWDQIQPGTRSQDIKLQKIQATLVKSMIPIVNIANNILEVRAGRAQKLSDDDIFRLVTDSLSLVTSTNQNITSRRREIIKTDLKDEYKSLCSNKLDETKFLFGEDLLQKVQNINTTNKVTNQLIQRPYGRGRPYHMGYGRGSRGRYTPYYHHEDGYFKRGSGRGQRGFLGRGGRGRRPPYQQARGKAHVKKAQQ